MSSSENIAAFLRRYKQDHHLSLMELSEELGIAKNSTVDYLSGDCNPTTRTVDLMAEKLGVSVAEIISAQPPGWERAEIVERAARLFSSLPPERRKRAVSLFLTLVDVLVEKERP